MKSIITSLVFLFLFSISSQSQNSQLDGKITIGNDNTPAIDGTIRYNSTTKQFEGYSNQTWLNLSFQCVCPYILSPYTSQINYGNYTLSQAFISMVVEFSHQMDPSSFTYGTNVQVIGAAITSAGGSFSWSNNNTRLTITPNEPWTTLSNSCFDTWRLEIIGTGATPVRGANGSPFDGDRDGCCGGDYSIRYGILC